jgi:phosphoribosylanthranilate isomerase
VRATVSAIVIGPVRVKFCGITNLDDAEHAARLGAWAIGLQHWEGSPRRCDPAAGIEIAAAVRRRMQVVGVFVNAGLDEIARIAEDETLAIVQLHGDEGPEFAREVARRTGCKVIKAIRVRSSAEVRAAEAFRTDFHLFDAHRPDVPGGTGESFDWELLARRRSEIPMLLAGGLTPENVAGAIGVVDPYAVDVASGVEVRPGVKDHARMRDFLEAANAVPTEDRAAAR